MTITVDALKTHVNSMNSGLLDFSQVELNTRADLVRFEGFSYSEACNISEDDAYNIMEGIPSEKIAVFYDCVGNEYMEFNITRESEVEAIITDYNKDGEYGLRFVSMKVESY